MKGCLINSAPLLYKDLFASLILELRGLKMHTTRRGSSRKTSWIALWDFRWNGSGWEGTGKRHQDWWFKVCMCMRTWNPFGGISRIAFENLEFSLWPKAVSSGLLPKSPGSLAEFQEGRGRLADLQSSLVFWYMVNNPNGQNQGTLLTDGSAGTFEAVWYISHCSRTGRFIILEDTSFSWSYSGWTVSWGWNKRYVTSSDLCSKLWWNTCCERWSPELSGLVTVGKQMVQPPQADCCLRRVRFLIFMGILLTSEWSLA